jgi:sarcosine oxidase subunit beta
MKVVVVGGGVVGLASAQSLARRGVDVVVCERETLGAGSTERSVGGIRTQFTTPVNVDLSLASVAVWTSFEETFGVDIGYRRAGYLFLARSRETARRFREHVALQNDRGGESYLLAPEAATRYCPGLDPAPFRAATYSPLDGFADPHLAIQGFAEACREAGVDVRTHTPVTGVRRERGRVVGVETADGPVDADYVVNAAGPWAGDVAEMAGVDLPITPKRRSVAVVEPDSTLPTDVPLTIDLDTGSYFRPEREGTALVGGHFGGADPTQDPDDYDDGMDLDWAVDAVERAAEYTSYFGPETRVRRGWSGLYAVTPDHHAIVDETLPGLITAAGFSGHGFQHAPATGQVVAELACDGEATLVDVTPLRSERFADGEMPDERNVA